MSLLLAPLGLKWANLYIAQYHRHHKPVPGMKFAMGAVKDGALVGVLIAGRPVARNFDNGLTLEVNRVCTDGTKNACSFLYGAARRAAKTLGYQRVITYTLPSEGGASLRGAGWKLIGEAGGGSWSCKSRPRDDNHPLEKKWLWEAIL